MSGTNFFKDFQKVNYSFGNKELPVKFQDISLYIDLFDQVAQYSSFYENYQIQNGERPDHVSYKLYQTPDYHWTFGLLNEKLRISSWPMDNFRIYEEAKKYYPHVTAMTTGSVFRYGLNRYDSMSTSQIFKAGGMIWFYNSQIIGRILKINHDLGQIVFEVIEPSKASIPSENKPQTVYGIDVQYEETFKRWNVLQNEIFVAGDDEEFLLLKEEIEDLKPTLDFTVLDGPSKVSATIENTRTAESVTYEYDSIHHFENNDGEHIFPTYYKPTNSYEGSFALKWSDMSTMNSVTYLERLQILNEEQRAIQVIKPDAITQVVSEFRQLLKN